MGHEELEGSEDEREYQWLLRWEFPLRKTRIRIDDTWVWIERRTPVSERCDRIAIQAFDSIRSRVGVSWLFIFFSLAFLGGGGYLFLDAIGLPPEDPDRFGKILVGVSILGFGLLALVLSPRSEAVFISMSGAAVVVRMPWGDLDVDDVVDAVEGRLGAQLRDR